MTHALHTRGSLALLAAMLLVPLSPDGEIKAQPGMEKILSAISYREIGPTRQGGRFVEYAVPLQQPATFYAATGSGGLWKTINHGRTFTSLLDETDIISIGSVAVAPSNPDIVWVGTGEANNSRSTYWGDGVYKSTDAGETWTHMGLPESHHIGRIVIHPRNPDIVYVAALGHLYSENPERGLYKTTDGGKTWTMSLAVTSEGRDIGVVDVVMDSRQNNTLYATSYDRIRRPWTFIEGGPGSAVYKSTDAGRTWNKLTNGLPSGMLGRIGLALYPKDPRILYAVIENVNIPDLPESERRQDLRAGRPSEGNVIGNEVYRTDDGGRNWRKVNERGSVGGNPPYYYGQIRVDPNDPEHVYNLGVGVTESRDGGRTWQTAFRFGGDNHDLWINPADSNHLILGHDHGMGVSFDAGRSWYHPDDMPLAQFYAVGYDLEYPYNVYGGTQDNGSWKGPSTRRGRGAIPIEEWFRTGGGDGMYNEPDPTDARWLYNESQFGAIQRYDQLTGQGRSIRYRREGLRFNWCAPILISPHDSNVIYHGANVLLRSSYRGENWQEISPDLTTNDPEKIRNTGNIQYATITTVDESPIIPGLLWVGTDDGNVQVTRDGGNTWTLLNDRIPGHPGYWVSRVVASFHDPAVAYVTFTGYRNDDFRPFVYRTADYGQSWTSLGATLPSEPVNVIREDRRNPDLLVVGTEKGVYVSNDQGTRWHSLRRNMPAVAVHDLKIHPREGDLIVGTHGRGMFIADITPLQQLTPAMLSQPAHLLRINPRIRWIGNTSRAGSSHNFAGQSESADMAIHYYLRQDAGQVVLRIYSGARLIREIEGQTEAGLHTAAWNLAGFRERTEAEREALAARQQRGQQQDVDPNRVSVPMSDGEYRVVLVVDGRQWEQIATIMPDSWFGR